MLLNKRPPNADKHDAYRVWLNFNILTSIGFTLVVTVNMIYQAQTVGLNPLQLVLVGTVLEITCFLFEVPTGIVADVYSRRLSVIVGSAMIGLGFMIEGLIPMFAGVLLAQVVWGIGATFHSGAGDAWLADEIGEDRAGQAYLRASQVGQIAAFFAIIASVLIASVNIQLAIVLGGSVHLLTALYLVRSMPEHGFSPKPKEERETFKAMAETLRSGLRVIRGRNVLMLMALMTFINGAFSESYDRLSTAHLLNNFDFPIIAGNALPDVIWFGILSLIGLLFGASLTEIVRRRVKTDTPRSIVRAMVWLNLALIACVLVFALSGNLLLALVAMFLLGAFRGVRHPLMTAWMNQGLDPQVRATVLSTIAQTDALGQIAGGPAIGYVGTVWGLRAALAIGGLLLTPMVALYAGVLRRMGTGERDLAASGSPVESLAGGR
jgi:DHA3 family tetracycline resistance protein-like MFS transporter